MNASSHQPDNHHLAVVVARVRSLRRALRDPAVALERMAPGVAPGIDLTALGLHAVRESALGALADFEDGEAGRANRAIDAVLALQIADPGTPWHGTWPITAEQPPPGARAVEWVDYDPNWRQFIGVILGLVVERHEADLGPERTERVVQALTMAARGEPEGRIPPWYTNPDLMHAWVAAWAGSRTGDRDLISVGEQRASAARQRVDATGDLDEYNSPTYDGIDLLALALWVTHPPTDAFARHGRAILAPVVRRIARLHHEGLGVTCGPYIRAYGLDPSRYVALVSLWLVAAGARPDDVLPWPLEETTDHVHDLWFAPMVALLAGPVVDAWPRDLARPRRHDQAFGSIETTSLLHDDWAIGAERGRRPSFARDQHVPVSVHTASAWLGLAPGDGVAGIDAEIDHTPDAAASAQVTARVVAAAPAMPCEVRTLWSEQPTIRAGSLRLGPVEVRSSPEPAEVRVENDLRGAWVTLIWPSGVGPVLTVRVRP